VSEPADLELSLRRKDATRYIVDLVFSQSGSEVDVRPLGMQVVTASFDQAELLALSQDPEGYGQALGRMLFADSALAAAVGEARAAAESQGLPLRLRLAIAPDAPELHALRWETLRLAGDGLPLALSEQVILTRALASADWRPVTLRAKGSLRALVVVAAPADQERFNLAPIDAAAEQERARLGLGSLPTETLAGSGQATLANLAAKLRDGYDILYLVAHGTFARDEPWLFLEDAQGAVARVSGADLVARLADLPARPRLVLLASCESAGDGSRAALAALGPSLAAAGIPAVIAMQGPLSIQTNTAFAPTFFRELQRDGRIDRALAAARQAVADRPDWWAPALFTRLRSGRIWYEPGFDEQDFQRWPALLRSLGNSKCTPILGPGLLEPVAGSSRDLAQRLAQAYNFPLAPFERDDLPQVAQYLAVNQAVAFMRDEVDAAMRAHLAERAPAALADQPSDAPLAALLSAAGAQRRAADPAEPHKVLAGLPLPIYLTANPDNLLADALRAAEPPRSPQVVICPWHLEERHFSGAEIEPPTAETPLVYHLLGHLDDPESLVISEDDYFRYLFGVKRNVELIPDAVQRALADTALLFLGFRFDDWSFRALLQSVLRLSGGKRRSQYAHVAVQIDPQEGATLNPQAARKYLKDYLGPAAAQTYQANISVYWGSAEDFIRELSARWQAEQRKQAPRVAVGASS
jgi:hypothetical protein